MATEFKIDGLAELDKELKQFPMRVQKNVLRGAVRAGSGVIVKEARRLAPKETGDLRRSIKARNPRIKDKLVIGGLRAGGGDAFYAKMIEFGTQSYTIKNYRRKRLYRNEIRQGIKKVDARRKALTIDGGLFAKADHPGIRPQPFMRTAMDLTTKDALHKVAQYIRERMQKERLKNAS